MLRAHYTIPVYDTGHEYRSDALVRRKLAAERMGPQRHMTLPLDERVNTAARKLGVSRALLPARGCAARSQGCRRSPAVRPAAAGAARGGRMSGVSDEADRASELADEFSPGAGRGAAPMAALIRNGEP